MGHVCEFLNYDVFLSLWFVLILANSADPDGMQHNDVLVHLCGESTSV